MTTNANSVNAWSPYAMLGAADEFFRAGERCGSLDDTLGIVADPGMLLFPYLMNYAIAAEVALKALYGIETGRRWKPPKGTDGHDLQALFHDLPEHVQAAFTSPRYSIDQVDRTLGVIKHTFTRWRYPYESGGTHTQKMSPLGVRYVAAQALRQLHEWCTAHPPEVAVPKMLLPFVQLPELPNAMPRRVMSRRKAKVTEPSGKRKPRRWLDKELQTK